MSYTDKRAKPLKVMKIIPDELSAFNELKRIKITEYIPKWRYDEENGKAIPIVFRMKMILRI